MSLNPPKIPDKKDKKSCCCIPIPFSALKTNKDQQLLELLSDMVKEKEDFESFLQGQRDLIITIEGSNGNTELLKKGRNNAGYCDSEESVRVAKEVNEAEKCFAKAS